VNIERKISANIKTKIVSNYIKQRQMLHFKNNTAEHTYYVLKEDLGKYNTFQVKCKIKQYLFIYSKGVIIND